MCDNARYYRPEAIQEYLKSSRIKLIFLPPYAPSPSLIERLRKFCKKKALYNRYFEAFAEFKAAFLKRGLPKSAYLSSGLKFIADGELRSRRLKKRNIGISLA
jgi:transposase